MKIKKQKAEKAIVFSKEIDSRINGLALGFSFIVIGLFLLSVPDYFGNELAGKIVRWLFIVIGTLGLVGEFRKLKPISNVKGFDELWVGALLLGGWAALFFSTQHPIWHIIGFFGLILGIFSTFLGLFRIIYSIHLNHRNKIQMKGTIASDVLILLTKIFSLALVVLQLVQVIKQ